MLNTLNDDVLSIIFKECTEEMVGHDYYTQYNNIRYAFSSAFKLLPRLSLVKIISDKHDSSGGVFKTNTRNDMFCVNSNCYTDTKEFFSNKYENIYYMHCHQTASIGSYYCTFCRMSLILRGINCRIKTESFGVI